MDKDDSSHGPGGQPPKIPESKEAESADFEYVSDTELSPPDEIAALGSSSLTGTIGSINNEIQGLGVVEPIEDMPIEDMPIEGMPLEDMPTEDMPTEGMLNEGPVIELRPSAGRADLRAGLKDLSSGDFINAEIGGYLPPPLQQLGLVHPTEEEAGGSVDEPIMVLKPAPHDFHDDEDDEDNLSSSELDPSPKESVESLIIPENNLVKPDSKSSLHQDLLMDAGETSGQDVDSSPKGAIESCNLDEFKEAVEEEVCAQPSAPVQADIEDDATDLLGEPIDLFCKMGLDPED